jgi:hypothetical protein
MGMPNADTSVPLAKAEKKYVLYSTKLNRLTYMLQGIEIKKKKKRKKIIKERKEKHQPYFFYCLNKILCPEKRTSKKSHILLRNITEGGKKRWRDQMFVKTSRKGLNVRYAETRCTSGEMLSETKRPDI